MPETVLHIRCGSDLRGGLAGVLVLIGPID